MSPLRSRAAVSLLAALLLAWAPPAGAADPEELRRTFLELINAQRASLGLQTLVLEPALVRAAQAHADDMSARQYAGFSSPQGRQSEDWTREAGYAFQVFTAKLAFTAEPPQTIAQGWKPESNRNSLFHPEVRDLGVGIGEVRGTPIYSFMLARSEKSYLDRYIAELYDRQAWPSRTSRRCARSCCCGSTRRGPGRSFTPSPGTRPWTAPPRSTPRRC